MGKQFTLLNIVSCLLILSLCGLQLCVNFEKTEDCAERTKNLPIQ